MLLGTRYPVLGFHTGGAGRVEKDELVGGWTAKYVEYFSTYIDDEIAKAHCELWLKKSLNHELNIRGIKKFNEFQIFHNFLNIEKQFRYCLTVL